MNSIENAPETEVRSLRMVGPFEGLPFEFSARTIRPETIQSQVRMTAPFLFEDPGLWLEYCPFLNPIFREYRPDSVLSPMEYFELCLAAQAATVGSYIPAELDHQIRLRLWGEGNLPTWLLAEMAELVLKSYDWDCRRLTGRAVEAGISAHAGEWLGVAVAAYASNRESNPSVALRVLDKIQFEIAREAKIFIGLKKRSDGKSLLEAAHLISLNLGELDRALEAWKLGADEVVQTQVAGLAREGSSAAQRFQGIFVEIAKLNRLFTAPENHRHLALRGPRSLRRSEEFMVPVAPFFDDWGRRLATHPSMKPSDLAEILDTLYLEWDKIKGVDGKNLTYAYPRAVAGMIEAFPGGMEALAKFLPVRVERNLKCGLFRSLVSVPRRQFESEWSNRALNFVQAAVPAPNARVSDVYLH